MIYRVHDVAVMFVCVAGAAVGVPQSATAQTQAVECPALKGATMEYGVPAKTRFDDLFDAQKAKPRKPRALQYVPPYTDGFSSGVNFVVDTDKGTVTVLWQLSAGLKAANRRAAPGRPHDDTWAPVTAAIVSDTPDEMLVAMSAGKGPQGEQVTTYTFFPKLYSVFVTRTTYIRGDAPDAMVITAQGTCDFSVRG